MATGSGVLVLVLLNVGQSKLLRSRSSGEGKPLGEGARQYRSDWVFRVADGAVAAC
jgi:hypothetical protein